MWLELVYPGSTYLSPVRLWFAAYIAIVIVGAALFGSDWFERADPFEVYSTLAGHLSVFGRTADGTLVLRSPLGNLDGVVVRPGLVGVVAVLFGSTAFDSFKDSNEWLQFTQSSSLSSEWLNLGALLLFCLVVGVSFAVATMATGVEHGSRPPYAAGPVRALGGADHHRLHRGALPELLRRGRPADDRQAQRPDGQRLRTCSAPRTCR